LNKILEVIKFYNDDPEIHGIMVQLPLPEHLESSKSQILNSIAPIKDVDGLRDNTKFVHPTAKAVMDIIDFANGGLEMSAKLKCFVVGENGMVGSSVTSEFKKKGYEFASKIEDADILVSATGKPKLITEDMIKKDAIVIDVGSPVGDCDLDLKSKASFVTPVPGGVGPVTIACLLENLISACYTLQS
jgi:methylenetetrahydrofolate dehydrogenase (NADP+)/methenyltetrahydrofolate cyclohydrolase